MSQDSLIANENLLISGCSDLAKHSVTFLSLISERASLSVGPLFLGKLMRFFKALIAGTSILLESLYVTLIYKNCGEKLYHTNGTLITSFEGY